MAAMLDTALTTGLRLDDGQGLEYGRIDATYAKAAFEAIEAAIRLAVEHRIAAICTAPIHKEALSAAGVPYPAHTELLADLSRIDDTGMMLVNPLLRTMLVKVHCSLLHAVAQLSVQRELRIVRLAWRTLRGMGIERPRIAVAGLNPHAGEGSLFGREDLDIILPAVHQARDRSAKRFGLLRLGHDFVP